MLPRIALSICIVGFVCVGDRCAIGSNMVWGAQQTDESAPVAEESGSSETATVRGLIDFARDVRPIMASKCLSCHGPEDAKNDFRVDQVESLLAYIEPHDVIASSLWSDYLISEDEDMRMPPASVEQAQRLTAGELATIKLWIEEGGAWSESSDTTESAAPVEDLAAVSMAERVWRFQGLFHPATTHFPIALLTVSAAFVFLSFFRPDTCEPVAFHCLWIGALGAIVAAAAGWSYATHEGYGSGFSFNLMNSAIDRHRWLGVAVAVLSVLLIPVAMYVRRTEDFGMRFVWMIGAMLILSGVGLSGYQGGELTYGEGHYEKEFVKLFPDTFMAPQVKKAETKSEQDSPKGPLTVDPAGEIGDEPEDNLRTEVAPEANTSGDPVVGGPSDEEEAGATNASVASPQEQPVEAAAEQGEQPVEPDAEQPSEQAAEQPIEQDAEKSDEQPADAQPEQPKPAVVF